MPTVLSFQAALVWFVFGLVVGAGWFTGAWIVGKILK